MAILLSNGTVNEGDVAGVPVGVLYPSSGSTYSRYELVSGPGDGDNGLFEVLVVPIETGSGWVQATQLRLKTTGVDRETKPQLSVRVRGTSTSGVTEDQVLTIRVNNLQDPVLVAPIPAQTLTLRQPQQGLNLAAHFDDPFSTGRLARYHLHPALVTRLLTTASAGLAALLRERPWIDVVLFDQPGSGAPLSAANLEAYIKAGRYNDTFIHRSVSGFVLQGGGWVWPSSGSLPGDVDSFAPVKNEYSPQRSNIRGTLAMAKVGGNPDSATSEWFFSLADNASNLDNQNGGFTVFGRVRGSSDLILMDLLAKAKNYSISNFPISQLALELEPNATTFSSENTLRFSAVELLNQPELTYSVVSSSPLLQATVQDGQLMLVQAAGSRASGQLVNVTITAANLLGETVQQVIQVQLPKALAATLSSAGQLITVEQQDNQATTGTDNTRRVNSHGTSDLIRLTAPLNLTLAARASERWGAGYGAQNSATGQLLPLVGLGRYSFVARDDTAEQGQLTIELDPTQASALFLHDAYSAFHEQLQGELGVDAEDRESLARLSRIDTIVMGGALGTSIVDLTSPDYSMGAITVHAGSSNGSRSVIWCGDGDDTVVGHGADMVIFGGNGRNAYSLSSGRDTLQYASSGTANDRVLAAAGFDPALDRIELWGPKGSVEAGSQPATPTPVVDPLPYTLTSQGDGMLLRWAGNSVLLEGLMDLPTNGLNISYRF